MNRAEEYSALLNELNTLPPALDQTVNRALARQAKTRRTRRGLTAALSSLGGIAAAFVLLVNFSLPFARACGKIPFLKELAQAVAFSPSLSAAVENEYVQPIDQTRSANGVTMTLRYLIADKRQMIVFYTLKSDDPDLCLDCYPSLRPAEGDGPLPEHGLSYGGQEPEDGLRSFTAVFTEDGGSLPDRFLLDAQIRAAESRNADAWAEGEAPAPADSRWDDEGPSREEQELIATLTFPVSVDLSQIQAERVYELNQDFVIDGQTITVERLEVYPTTMQIVLADHPENTAWLTGLDFYLTDSQGREFGREGGITAIGDPDSPFVPIHRVESAYFTGASGYTLHITSARWLEKDLDRVTVNLETGEADRLPESITGCQVDRLGEGYYDIRFITPHETSMPVQSTYWNSSGQQGGTNGYSWTRDENGTSTQKLRLKKYSDTTVTFELSYSKWTEFDTPVSVTLN